MDRFYKKYNKKKLNLFMLEIISNIENCEYYVSI